LYDTNSDTRNIALSKRNTFNFETKQIDTSSELKVNRDVVVVLSSSNYNDDDCA